MNKKAFFLLTIACLVGAGARSQKVTISGKGLSLGQVFEQIKLQTGYDFVYNQDDIDQAKKVDLQFKNAPLKDVLDYCLHPQGFTYEIRNKIIGIRRPVVKKPASNRVSVTGLVVDTSAGNSPLPDASILIQGSQRGVRSDQNGYFTLEDIDPGTILLISYAGYRSRQIAIDRDAGFIYTPLEPGDGKLDEVQTIAYGKVSDRFNTGNVTTVKGSDLAMQPVGNALLALQGLVPGLEITQLTGAPGGGVNVQLRGQSSIQSKTDPLYVIDGIPYDPSHNETFVAGFNDNLAGGSLLNMINPSDIESIDVLKDADATAIYGSQGANGIILITTKKGRPGPPRFTLDIYSGLGAATTIPHYLGLSSYLAMRHEALRNDSAAVGPTDYDINGVWDTTRYTNWPKMLMGHMVRTNDLQGQLTGGNNNLNYFAGAGFYSESTVYPGDGGEKKGSVHLNVNGSTPDKRLDLQLTGSWLSAVNTVQSESVTALMATAADAPPAYLRNDSLNWQDQTFNNPLAPLTEQYNTHSHTLITSALLTFHVLKGLDLKANVGYNELYHRDFQGTPATTTDPWIFTFDSASNFRSATFYHDDCRSWIFEPQASYTGRVSKGVLTALAGASYWHNTEKASGALGSGFPSDASLSDLAKATMTTPLLGEQDDYKYNALFGRLNYNWKREYIASLNGRYDGSSRFGPDRQYHFFGSLAAVWIFTAEPFFGRRLPWLSFGKLRASYGATGNDRIQGFLSQGTFDSTFSTYQGVYGLQPASLADPDISWESTRKIEIGLDLGFGKDRFLLDANYYRFRSSDLLLDAPLSAVTGLSGITENLPIVVGNEGLELALQSINIKSTHFSWTTSATLTIPRTKLVRFDNLDQTYEQGQLVIGDPLNIVHAFRAGGVDPQTGLYRFIDSSGNYTSQPQVPRDLTAIVRLDPSLYGGVTNRFQYKSFILEVLLFYNRQVNTNPNFAIESSPGIEGTNVLVQTANARWRYPGQTATVQRYGTGFPSQISHGYAWSSNLAYSNAAYLRCKNIYLAYQFPATFIKKMHMNDFTCYIKGQNLFTISSYKNYDPETGINIAPLRVLTAGLKAGF